MYNKVRHFFKYCSIAGIAFVSLFLEIYQKIISPFFGQNCRHYPSCSQYSKESFQQHGIIKGTLLTIARLLRCNPWSLGGFDPVPEDVRLSSPSSFKLSGNYQTQLYKFHD